MNNSIPLAEIVILENRQRQEFDAQALMELTESITSQGLMHAPVMRQENGQLILVAGERRLEAIQDIWMLGGEVRYNGELFPEPLIPYVTLGELSVLEAEEAELDENLRRMDLTWQEHAAAVEKLHNLREAQSKAVYVKAAAAAKEGNTPPPAPRAYTVADTAAELTGRRDGAFQDNIRKELLVARHLNSPEIAKAKNVDEAFKLLKRKEEVAKNTALAASVGATFNAGLHRLLNVNCIDWMEQAENHGQFDVILTDPPYGMGADDFGDAGGKLTAIEHGYEDSKESWTKLMQDWTVLSYACAKPEAHAYVFCDIDNFHELKLMMQNAGWYVFRTPFTVHKLNSGRVPLPDRGPRRQSEWLLYAIKGKMPVTHIYGDVITCNGDDNLGHGAQKPVALYQNLLQRSVRAGMKVLDSFAGTGTIFPACHTYKCEATGLEMSPNSYGIALNRLSQLDAQSELPV